MREEDLVKVVPSPRQIAWQKMEYYNFVHFGMNTYTGREWGDGKTSPKKFNPYKLDCEQWVRAFKASGSRGVILTAKHHDGFCLFPSKYTDYTVANSPYKDGKGDIVRELADACRKYDLKLGLYLSPWDMHEKSYGTEAYNDFFVNQLTELCSNYGELFSLWFDGACGEGENGKKQRYDFERYYALIRELQPNAAITICGPDARWIGNERGNIREEEWSVVPRYHSVNEHIAENSQHEDKGRLLDVTSEDIGSRAAIEGEDDLIWYPAEMDVTITKKCWFWHKGIELFYTRPVSDLKRLYYESVGHNATLLLNVPANRKGLIPDRFVKLLAEFGEEIKSDFSKKVNFTAYSSNEGVYAMKFNASKIKSVVLMEDIERSQRIEEFTVEDGGGNVLYRGKTVGYKQICPLNGVECSELIVRIKRCRMEDHLLPIEVYAE